MTRVSFVKSMESYKVSMVAIIGEPHMTPFSFVKSMESYEICRLGNHLSSTFTETDQQADLITALDQIAQAMHSCNSWFSQLSIYS